MAVYYGPEQADSTGQRIISTGGNIFTLGENMHVGSKTRGRGFWIGPKRKDKNNPDVDNPKDQAVNTLYVPKHKGNFGDDDVRYVCALIRKFYK